MSFSSDIKAELCKIPIQTRAAAVAESYGILLHAGSFEPGLIRIMSRSEDVKLRAVRLFKKAFNLDFDYVSEKDEPGLKKLRMEDIVKIEKIYNAFGFETKDVTVHHINLAVLEREEHKTAFLRGSFLTGGTMTDPDKQFNLSIVCAHRAVAREMRALLMELGFEPLFSERATSSANYFRRSELISDFLTTIGAPVAAMRVLNAKIERDMRNKITRQINCDDANTSKQVEAAERQLDEVRKIFMSPMGESLSDELHEAAMLRFSNPSASISDLARLAVPPISKSAMSSRLRRLLELAKKL